MPISTGSARSGTTTDVVEVLPVTTPIWVRPAASTPGTCAIARVSASAWGSSTREPMPWIWISPARL